MTHPTRLLLGARRRALGHRLRPEQRARLSLIALVILALALLIGHLMAPGWLTPPPPDAIAAGLVPRAQQVPGASALEAAFWLTALGIMSRSTTGARGSRYPSGPDGGSWNMDANQPHL